MVNFIFYFFSILRFKFIIIVVKIEVHYGQLFVIGKGKVLISPLRYIGLQLGADSSHGDEKARRLSYFS